MRLSSLSRILPIVVVMFLCLEWLACNGDDNGTDPVDQESRVFEDLIFFDTSSYVLLKIPGGDGEPFRDGDSVIGEPFIDVNGDHLYDPQIDTFVVSTDPNNMDLNGNGVHDGPEIGCTLAIPFLDLNGNSACEEANGVYDSTELFVDFNRDGSYTRNLAFSYYMTRCVTSFTGPSKVLCEYTYVDSAFQRTFDLGPYQSAWICFLPEISDFALMYLGGGDSGLKALSFEVTDSGVVFIAKPNTGGLAHDSLCLPLLPYAPIVEATDRVGIVWKGIPKPELSFDRSVYIDTSLQIGDTLFVNLVLVRFDHPIVEDSVALAWYLDSYWEFYFSEDLGLVGIIDKDRSYFLDDRWDSVPVDVSQ